VPVVVDTDVVSFLYKRDTRARLYEPHLNDPPFIVSFMSLAELRRWTLERNWEKESSMNWKSISRDT
jgi:tRNA(fMet)-specific endonuclease VapC